MSFLIISPRRDPKAWVEALKKEEPELDLEIYPDIGNPEKVEFALSWRHPQGTFLQYPNLKAISSMGAGVDHILRDPQLPENIQVVRIVDEQLSTDMAEFILALVMNQLRDLSMHKQLEQQQEWKPRSYKRIEDVKIGIMGMGELGITAAQKLVSTGFSVSGWARSQKDLDHVKMYAGSQALEAFLSETNILICLLPLTEETENILNKELFKKLPKNAFLINVARGQHLVEEDLIEMIDNGHLAGAALDVFREEPLPEEHPFWKHTKIHVTPHVASITSAKAVAPQVLNNYRRMRNEENLQNVVDLQKGY